MVPLGKGPEGKIYGCSGDQAWNHGEVASAIAELSEARSPCSSVSFCGGTEAEGELASPSQLPGDTD